MTGFHFGVFLIELGQVFIALGLITFVVAFSWGAILGPIDQLRVFFTWSLLLVGVGLGWTTAIAQAWAERRLILRAWHQSHRRLRHLARELAAASGKE